ncbi:MAG: hypothetical protein PVJ73_19285 [Acidobacteriota bacterium]|jgi:hypothetical protein
MFNALNHTQFRRIDNTANFASQDDPTITNLPYDENGDRVHENGFGSISSVYPQARSSSSPG